MEPDMHGAGWRKASYSMANGNCVEAISTSTHIAVRDSVNPGAIIILYPTRAWQVFIDDVKAGSSDPDPAVQGGSEELAAALRALSR